METEGWPLFPPVLGLHLLWACGDAVALAAREGPICGLVCVSLRSMLCVVCCAVRVTVCASTHHTPGVQCYCRRVQQCAVYTQ